MILYETVGNNLVNEFDHLDDLSYNVVLFDHLPPSNRGYIWYITGYIHIAV